MVDWGAGASSGITGALTGFGVGGPVGAAVGGVGGGIAGLFGSGKKKKKKRSSLDKNQKALNEQQFAGLQGQGPLADLYNYDPEQANDVFDQNVSRPAYRNFQEKLAPNITGQFRNQGLMNSSYAGDALSRVARDIQEGLDAQRSQYLYGQQQDATTAKRSAVENLQNRQTFAYDTAAQPGGFNIDSILSSVNPANIDQFKNYFNQQQSGSMAAPSRNPSMNLLNGVK